MLLAVSWLCFYFGAIGLIISLAGWLYFCFKAVNLVIDLMVGLVINEILLMASKVAVGLSRWSL